MDTAGRYMLPIRFDKHCGACHPLLVTVKTPGGAPELRQAAEKFAREPVRHPQSGETARTVRALLRELYLDFARRFPAALAPGARAEPERPLPGSWRGRPVSDKELNWLQGQVNHGERLLFDGPGGCRRCHEEKAGPAGRSDGLPDFVKPDIPMRWFNHSVFNHEAHRMLTCTECHPGNPAWKSEDSKAKLDMLLPKLADCRRCHGNAPGARADCAECHTYHPRSVARDWRGKLSVQDCTGQK
jgi:hypothetical protein